MIRPRRGGPGLIGTAARTAVIAGTATRVSGNVAASQQAKAQQRVPVQQPPQPTVVVAAPAPPAEDTIAQLERLAALHQQGALTEAEFTAAKARLLGF
ncbi:SHOCT domain-containing protein [Propioniciclava sp. MC1683]|uniref:SHOCT domain-containing protein n=1 Tax=unclassified Propioniciclava TaxID=2642922 RepID=UPI0016017C9D|nr:MULTISPECIES: SHOCT domain-containing protein [unclassified Propioniciclava]MBB1493713.1 SHOCT domain-containing protein [Propioniciclava sp. MC1595]MBB1502886.1 SHOCT domain-containing protein [Propioniciclava sp. MC1683]